MVQKCILVSVAQKTLEAYCYCLKGMLSITSNLQNCSLTWSLPVETFTDTSVNTQITQ